MQIPSEPHKYKKHYKMTLNKWGFPYPKEAFDKDGQVPCDKCGASEWNPRLHSAQ